MYVRDIIEYSDRGGRIKQFNSESTITLIAQHLVEYMKHWYIHTYMCDLNMYDVW